MTAINSFQEMTKRNESGDVFDVAGMQQSVNHVKHEQRLHPVVRETFPCFGERDVAEPTRVSKEAAVLWLVHERRVLPSADFGKLSAQCHVERLMLPISRTLSESIVRWRPSKRNELHALGSPHLCPLPLPRGERRERLRRVRPEFGGQAKRDTPAVAKSRHTTDLVLSCRAESRHL